MYIVNKQIQYINIAVFSMNGYINLLNRINRNMEFIGIVLFEL